jgi:hypothetical protein
MELKPLRRKSSTHYRGQGFMNHSDSEELCINRFSRAAVARESKIKSGIQILIENRNDLIQNRDPLAGSTRIRGHSVINYDTKDIVSYSKNLKILKKMKNDVKLALKSL